MRKLLPLVFLMLAQYASAAAGECSIVVAENGNALVLIGLEGSGSVDVPLPLDVSYPEVFNALYVESADGIEVSLPGNESVTVAYQTSMLTSKTGAGWVLEADFGGPYSVLVSLPKTARIKATEPKGYVTETEDSRHVSWDEAESVRVEYDFTAIPVTPTTTLTSTSVKTATTTLPAGGGGGLAYVAVGFAAVALLFMAAVTVYIYFVRRGPTEGMRKVMRTLSGNEYKIVDTLVKHKGGMRRSELERTAGLSKSSLALALNSLERKNIVEVDRTNTTHYVEVTKWFKGL